ncbi:MAG: nitroreductase family protein [Candidatus Cloacimonetes bacterium]|nr:nitroreductase family protein [Candidatus Cloacimonadota bacterium]MCF7813773.1 nitroreductase family protein [Candidatus Cloacimonadota bacterium]MCF7868355.1 nitroreductase family protein [Candidatus Cloacimonadota bacterium]MCF7883829.1 nitroreductase family protein [Candidatus Cloacimonadota bacterium]
MLIQAIKDRFSARKFKDKPVEQEKLDEILEAARLAPSASNKQTWKFVVIRDIEKRKQLTEICRGQKFVSEAPITIAICNTNFDYVMTCGMNAPIIDGAIAAEHIVLQAAELGLGTCWIGAFYHDKMAELINLPKDYKIVGLLPLGYPDVEKGKRNLKPKEEVILWDSF